MSELTAAVMHCPLCGNGLRESDRGDDGRYRCRLCFERSVEAQKGWVPTARTVTVDAVNAPSPPGGFTRALQDDPMFAKDASGKVISRERCCECGNRFVQRLLSERYMLMVERQGKKALALVKVEIPDYFVPVHCPPCERRDLGISARRSAFRLMDAAD